MEADNLKMVFTTPPALRMVSKQLAKLDDNFKEGFDKPTFHEDGLHAPMEAGNFKDGLHKPTFLEDGLASSLPGDIKGSRAHGT